MLITQVKSLQIGTQVKIFMLRTQIKDFNVMNPS